METLEELHVRKCHLGVWGGVNSYTVVYQILLKLRVVFISELGALKPRTHHMSMGVEYSVEPRSTSGGRYHRVTTSLE